MLRKFIVGLLILLTMSCGSLKPLPITRLPEGNISRLMEMPEYEDVKMSDDKIKRWAREALHTINDLEFQLRTSND